MDEAIFNIIRSDGTDFVLWFFCTYLSHSQFSSALILVVEVIQRLHYCNSMSRSETLSNFPNVTFDLQIYSTKFWLTFTSPLAIIFILITNKKHHFLIFWDNDVLHVVWSWDFNNFSSGVFYNFGFTNQISTVHDYELLEIWWRVETH